VPENEILKLLDNTRVKHPKLLKNKFKCFEEEYIEGRVVSSSIDNSLLINMLSNYIFELKNININPIKKYIKWKDNTEFFYFQLASLIKASRKYKYKNKLAQMGLDENLLQPFKNVRMNDSRNLYIIHGDFCKKNIIEKFGEYYIIGWEYATFGDIAYEIAIHLSRESYSEQEMKLLIDRICASLALEPNSLIKDIKSYMDFERIRICFERLNRACELQKNKKDIREDLDAAYEYYKYLANAKSKDEIKSIILS
jgi:thiamine kinase-like enzyme